VLIPGRDCAHKHTFVCVTSKKVAFDSQNVPEEVRKITHAHTAVRLVGGPWGVCFGQPLLQQPGTSVLLSDQPDRDGNASNNNQQPSLPSTSLFNQLSLAS
jgi:hypothetical protein